VRIGRGAKERASGAGARPEHHPAADRRPGSRRAEEREHPVGHRIRTVLKALAAGVPLVCIPIGRDQKDNATRVLRLGAGLQVSKRDPSLTATPAYRDI
jgi:UDP-glucoronosyl and UDP-glucosyl transferase